MSIFTNFSKVWSHITTSAEKLFDDEEKRAQDFINPLLHVIVSSGGAILIDAAVSGAAAAESAGGSLEEKFKTAFEVVKNVLESKGIPLVENAVRGVIEAAVANLNKSQTPSA